MRLEEHFESSSTLQRNERVKLAASFNPQRVSHSADWYKSRCC